MLHGSSNKENGSSTTRVRVSPVTLYQWDYYGWMCLAQEEFLSTRVCGRARTVRWAIEEVF